ncbi:DUF1501 domain-containing protein [soil metagenome]
MTSAASRREFLRRAAALSAYGAAAPMALSLAGIGSAAAQSAGGDYKAIVCLFMFGGNDTFNMILPTDSASWNSYTTVRNQAPDPISLRAVGTAPNMGAGAGSPDRLGGVLAIEPTNNQGRTFALHPLMTAARDLFAAKRLAIVPNIGPLIRPTTKAQWKTDSYPKPAKLFSHNDQQSTWQTLAPEGATIGWGGRFGDLLASSNGMGVFTSVSASGNQVWLSGDSVKQYQVSNNGAIRIGGGSNNLFGSQLALTKAKALMRTSRSGHLFEQDYAAVVGRSIDAELALTAALPAANTAPYGTVGQNGGNDPLLQFTNVNGNKQNSDLAQQLQIVARTIGARSALGAKRQIFFVSTGGFDTHDNQNRAHGDNMAKLSHALEYFNNTLTALGVADQVTTFTASDFGRTFTSNGDGTDHGWGAHHFVMGGAVKGGDLYGAFPQLGVSDGKGDFTSPDQIGNGSLLPTTTVEQLGATLGRWFGGTEAQMLDIFPNLANFDANKRNLGFMNV